MELARHQKFTAVLAVVLCLPLLLILWFTVQLLTGASAFKGISEVRIVLPDGMEYDFREDADVSFYTGILNRSSLIDRPVRETEGETPVTVFLDQAEYRFYPSLSLSGCMAETPEGRLRLFTSEDAAALVVRAEMEYLYDGHRLPSLAVCSGDNRYEVLPDTFVWSYKKADSLFYQDQVTETASTLVTCNLFSDFENSLSFSVQPSSYSLTVYRYLDGEDSYEIPVTSLAGLQFTQDTLVSVEINAKWSQASNAEQFGEATYRFLALYDVPAEVELLGAGEDGSKTVQAGSILLLRALYTNENEDLSVRADFQTDNTRFYYDAVTQSSYAVLPVSRETAAGAYEVIVTSGETVKTFAVTVTAGNTDGFLSLTVGDEEYAAQLSKEKREALEETLRQLRAASDGTPRLNADLVFGDPVSGEVALTYGSTVSFGNTSVEGDSGVCILEGTVYTASEGAEVQAVQSGICVFAGDLGAGGYTVVIDHGCGVFSYYYHLKELRVSVGEEISRSSAVGIIGDSGYVGTAVKPCLHFALSVGELYVYP